MEYATLLTHPLTQRCAIGVTPLAIKLAQERNLAELPILYKLGDAEIKWRQTCDQLFIGNKPYFKPATKTVVQWFVENLANYIKLTDAVTRKATSSDFLIMTNPDFAISDDLGSVGEALASDLSEGNGVLPIITTNSGLTAKFVSRDLANLSELINQARMDLCAVAQLPPSDLFGVDFSSTFASANPQQLAGSSVEELLFKWELWLNA